MEMGNVRKVSEGLECKMKDDADAPDDADPGPQDLLLWQQYTNTHGLHKSCGRKGTMWPLSLEESASEHLCHSLKRRTLQPLL